MNSITYPTSPTFIELEETLAFEQQSESTELAQEPEETQVDSVMGITGSTGYNTTNSTNRRVMVNKSTFNNTLNFGVIRPIASHSTKCIVFLSMVLLNFV